MSTVAKGATRPRPLPQLAPRFHRVLGNPLRYAIVMKLGEGPASPKQLATELDEEVKRVSEAIEQLLKADLVEFVGKSPGPKGGMVHTYRAGRHVFDPEEWAELPGHLREATSFAITKVLFNQVGKALASGSFDSHDHRVLIRRPIWVDNQGVAEVDEIMVGADKAVAAVERKCLERRSRCPDPPIRLVTAQLSFPVDSDNWSSTDE